MNSTSISRCNYCGQYFCTECTDAKAWREYCCIDCEENDMIEDEE